MAAYDAQPAAEVAQERDGTHPATLGRSGGGPLGLSTGAQSEEDDDEDDDEDEDDDDDDDEEAAAGSAVFVDDSLPESFDADPDPDDPDAEPERLSVR